MTDFRSFAKKSTKQSIGYYEQRDAKAALSYVRNVLGAELDSPLRIGLFGASMGGAVALLVSHDAENKDHVKAIVTDCAFSSLRSVISHQMRVMFPFMPDIILQMSEMSMELFNIAVYDYSLSEIEPISVVSSSNESKQNPPLLLIHAENDETVRRCVCVCVFTITFSYTYSNRYLLNTGKRYLSKLRLQTKNYGSFRILTTLEHILVCPWSTQSA